MGTEELRLLRLIAERGPMSVRDASDAFGGVRLTTVGQMMERLRRKGYLERQSEEGVFRYASLVGAEQLLEGVVREFVRNSLGGSIAPFALFLAKGGEISPEELGELKCTVDRLSRERDE